MKLATSLIRRYAVSGVALIIVLAAYGATRRSVAPSSDPESLARRFAFSRSAMPELPGREYQVVRPVAPSLQRISGWISAVGAAATLADLDGDGLPNDLIWVDARTDLVTVAPAPTTPQRYAPFELSPAPLQYDRTMAPMGAVAGDFNEDGLMDILVIYWGRPPIAFLRTTSPERERRVALSRESYIAQEVAPFERWYSSSATQADLDGDGHLDLIVANYFQDGAHILDPGAGGVEVMHDTKSRSFNGGWKHLLRWKSATGDSKPSVAYEDVKGVLSEEVSRGWTLAIGAADLDGDMLPEIYFANDFGPDRLLHNRSRPGYLQFALLEGERGLTTPKSCVLGRDSFKGMGIDFGDFNGDGLPDMFVSNITSEFALQESHFLWQSTGQIARMRDGIAPYVQAAEERGVSRSGWGWDLKIADFDNDGVLEILQATGFMKGKINRWPELQSLGTGNDQLISDPRHWPAFKPGDDVSGHEPDAFFVQGSDGRYQNIAEYVGLGEDMNTRGVALADVDGDGRLDFALANQFEPSYFYHNDSPAGAFLGLHLLLPLDSAGGGPMSERLGHPGPDTPGRPAIGAAVTVHLPDGRRLVGQVDGGNGFSGRRSPDLHFGLGSPNPLAPGSAGGSSKLKVDLRWRDAMGRIEDATVELSPGWHTILLGRPIKPAGKQAT